jgi:hypothetical protein
MKDILARCLKKTDVQVCTVHWLVYTYCSVIATFTLLLHMYLLITNNCRPLTCTSLWLYNNRCLFFCRLKINHESHEFILDSATVTNSYPYVCISLQIRNSNFRNCISLKLATSNQVLVTSQSSEEFDTAVQWKQILLYLIFTYARPSFDLCTIGTDRSVY